MKELSTRAQKILFSLSQEEGKQNGNVELLPEHFLLALLKKGTDSLGYILLQSMGINILSFQLALEQAITPEKPVAANQFSDLPFSRRLRTLVDVAVIESRTMQNEYIGTEHFVLSAMHEENSVAYRFFQSHGVTLTESRKMAVNIQLRYKSSGLKQVEVVGANAASSKNVSSSRNENTILSEFARDLTELARKGNMDPVVGRNKEISRIIQILSRRTKNNPILIGEPGVGKSAIIDGLAQKIASGNVPASLLKKRVLNLDLAAMVAGTKYRGDFEERMKRLLKEVKEDKDVILFIDELHTIIGAGGPEGAMDASNILKPALGRGEIQIVGATTIREYRRYFEKDTALVRRFQIVNVEEPDEIDTEAILNGLKEKYEQFHGVHYEDDVIPAIVKFAKRYIPERFLPDKAIDILDEAGAAKKILEEERPSELAELEKSIEKLSEEKQTLVTQQNYEMAAEVRDKVRELKERLNVFSEYWKNSNLNAKRTITVEDVCNIISEMTSIPVSQFSESEAKRLLEMENILHETVIGQDDAIKVISGAIRRARSGISSSKRPLGSFIFLGPTGVGKTQLAKSLANFLFGKEDALIRVDMSDFMEKHTVSRLVGAPPGYVGFEDGGMLTDRVRKNPYSVVLLDEIEKAHPDIFNLLLQLLEEGELVDSHGHRVSFKNTVILMTSNAGAREITSDHRLGFASTDDGVLPYDDIRKNAMEELKRLMNPELLNRLDDIIVFNALSRKQIEEILKIQLKDLEDRLAEKNISLKLKPKAKDYLLDNGYNPSMGARPMRRLLQKEIEDPLSILILEGKHLENPEFTVDFKKNKLVVTN